MSKTNSATMTAALRIAATHGHVVCACPGQPRRANAVSGATFAALVKSGLMTHDVNGTPEPGFFAWVDGTEGYLTPAGKAAIA
jgi:hypothetical protein